MAKKKDPLKEAMSQYFRKMGAKGGKIGGAARVANMTPAELSEAGTKAVNARWAKARKAKAKGDKANG